MSKTAYVIAISQPNYGLMTLYKHIASHIIYAKEMGYIPIVDCKHYSNLYFKDNREFKENTWEYFFEQPAGFSLDDIDKFDNVVISQNTIWAADKYKIFPKLLGSIGCDISHYSCQYVDELKINADLKEKLEKIYCEKVKNETIIGVLCRGTDYTNMKPAFHSVQPTAEEMIEKTKQIMIENKEITKIYLATEDFEIYSKFKNTFGNALIDNEQYLFPQTGKNAIADIDVSRENHFYNLGIEYLTSLYILSKCPYFVAGKNNGSLGVYLLSSLFKNQKYVYIFDLGVYGNFTYKNLKEKIFSIKKEEFVSESENRDYKKTKRVLCVTVLGIKLKMKI